VRTFRIDFGVFLIGLLSGKELLCPPDFGGLARDALGRNVELHILQLRLYGFIEGELEELLKPFKGQNGAGFQRYRLADIKGKVWIIGSREVAQLYGQPIFYISLGAV